MINVKQCLFQSDKKQFRLRARARVIDEQNPP